MSGEFEFIRNIKKKYGLARVGDDCAVLPQNSTTDLVISADLLVEDIDFRRDWTTPEQLGHKALAVSLSDIASMGAKPVWAMLSVAVPRDLWEAKFMDRFFKGWAKLASSNGVELIGGDISRTDSKLTIDSIVAGNVRHGRAVLRSGAKPGDSIFVTGSLGGAAGGLRMLETGKRFPAAKGASRNLIMRQLVPTARVEAGRKLLSRKLSTAMIDISDGLAADLHHICEASGVGAEVEARLIPVDKHLKHLASAKALELALSGGEDFELLFTSRRKNISAIDSLPVTRIGVVTEHGGRVELITDGDAAPLPPLGYLHF